MTVFDFDFATNTSGATHEISHGGRRYLVAPVVALKEGVLNGTLVSAAEFGKFATSWSGRPVPISHPKSDGGYTSANTPDIWANDVLGHLWNVSVDSGALKGEIWIDLDKAQLMGERAMQIVNKLRAGSPMEVSTGYFCEMEVKPGTWGGQPYTGVARNIRPDHLAILPDEAGACSWADGCGTPRVNSQEIEMDEQTLYQRFLGWLKNDQSQNLEPAAANDLAVMQESILEPNVPREETLSMGKTELIGLLVANQKCKFSQEKLTAWDESDLTALRDSLAANEETEEVPATPPEAPAVVAQDDALLARITLLEDAIKGLTANQAEERKGLVAGIVANCRGAFKADDLTRYDNARLREIYGSYQPRDYSANAGAYRDMSGPEDEELLMVWPQYEPVPPQWRTHEQKGA